MRPKSEPEIELMRIGGRHLAQILDLLAKETKSGVKPTDLSAIARKEIKKRDLQPVLLGYEGFPDVMCISVNDGMVHGIPSSKPFKEGDVVKLDLTVGYKGMIVDSAITTIAGAAELPEDIKRLIKGTKEAMEAGINAVHGAGTRVGDIASAAQKVMDHYSLGVVRDLVGHGVGYEIHEAPNVPNYGIAGTGPVLQPGMTIAIEPMATLGDWQVKTSKDGWTIASRDGSLTAHFEHTVLVTDNGVEILTSL